MGSDFYFQPGPSSENLNGFFEDVRFRNVNDKILKNAAYDVKSWKTPIPTCKSNETLRRQIRGVLEKRSMGAKDPRFCLTWPVWNLPQDTEFYLIFRNPVAVANSLMKRGNTSTLEQGFALWNQYNKRALPIRKQFKTTVIQYEDLLEQPELAAPDVKNLIDKTLQHNEPESIPGICKPIWDAFYSSKKTQP